MGTDLNLARNPPLLSGWMVLNATAPPFRKRRGTASAARAQKFSPHAQDEKFRVAHVCEKQLFFDNQKEKPMSDDKDAAYKVTADEITQFVERAERLGAEKRDISDQEKELYAEAKGRGYDTKILKKVIALRARDPNDVAEEEAVLDSYKSALGMA